MGALPDVGRLGPQLVGDAGLAVLTLLVTTTLSVYKPWGKTRYGRHQAPQVLGEANAGALSVGLKIVMGVIAAIVATIIVVHLAGGGLHHGR